jgi:hypothetical protein
VIFTEFRANEPGDFVLVDGKGLDGALGTEALRLCGDGRFLVRGIRETDPVLIVRALRDWTVRALDAVLPPTTDAKQSLDGPISPDEGRVQITAMMCAAASIVMDTDGGIYINGALVEHDDKLRRNFRRVLGRLRMGV